MRYTFTFTYDELMSGLHAVNLFLAGSAGVLFSIDLAKGNLGGAAWMAVLMFANLYSAFAF